MSLVEIKKEATVWAERHSQSLTDIGNVHKGDIVIKVLRDGSGAEEFALYQCLTKHGLGWVHSGAFDEL